LLDNYFSGLALAVCILHNYSTVTQTPIVLTEYQPRLLSADTFTQAEAQTLWDSYQPQLLVDPPSFQNNQQWVLTPQGWAGHIPVSTKTTLIIEPKVSVLNLFAMLQLVYKLPSFRFLDGLTQVETITGFIDLLAYELANRVLDRLRKGIYKEYHQKREPLGTLRGRIDPQWIASQPTHPKIQCDFTDQTADLPFNQILAYTLRQVALTGLCSNPTLRLVNRAWRQLPVSLKPFTAFDCANWDYTRLNEDYRPMHSLCSLFLDRLSPTHHVPNTNSRMMVPFLVNMPLLYEKYVASWLQTHLPEGYTLREQERVLLDASQARHVNIDLVIFNTENRPVIVLDTKYKSGQPTNDDIYQVTFYAREIGCYTAGLIYPIPLEKPLTGRNQDVTYHSLTFTLDDEPDTAGAAFLDQIALKTI
jgi:5-methylcytosine-specific restriction enzyme subunit McrC